MRAISQSQQNAIITNVREYLHTTPFDFEDDYAKVIPGTDEGVFGWITVNYALQLLILTNPSTYGAMGIIPSVFVLFRLIRIPLILTC
jgi:Golgi nucleoside diphosphatase